MRCPPPLDKEDVEQIEMILDTVEDEVESAHKQQYIEVLYVWYKRAVEMNEKV